jgi:hypothetical protein
MARKIKLSPMQQAVHELFCNEPNGSGSATPEQIKAAAEKYEVEVWAVEGYYLDAVDRLADE